MKFAFAGDLHWSQYSSILRKRGDKYSARLENCIASVNWFNSLAENLGCDALFFLGDYFDKSELNSEEISALEDIKWANIPTYFLAGNHEMGSSNHEYSSSKLFNLLPVGEVLFTPNIIEYEDFEIAVLPYILETNRKSLSEYFTPKSQNKKRIMISHNDIAGIQMGPVMSTQGFDINDLEKYCDICINGHLHNGGKISDKIINIGNLTGQNFSEDAFKYEHSIIVIDTDNIQNMQIYVNPYAYNFYKIDMSSMNYPEFKPNSVVTFKCKDSYVETLKGMIANTPNIVEYRIVVERELTNEEIHIEKVESFTVDHIQKFYEYMIENYENTEILFKELEEISR